MCNAANIMNSVGLIFDIGGVVLLFKFGLPAEISRSGATTLVTGQINQAEVQKGKIYDRYAWTALCLLVLGFSLQLISNWI